MIYFIQNKTTGDIKIGYSKNPKKRLTGLQTATPHDLTILGVVQGGLDDEAAFHQRFAGSALKGEWLKVDILRDVLEVIARDAACPQPQKTNVIVAGDCDPCFMWASDERQMAARGKLEATMFGALDVIHAKPPVAWVITGGERQLDEFAWQWAGRNKAQIYRYYPNWKRHGRSAGFKVGPQMLPSMFDPKVLLVFLAGKVSSATRRLVRGAEKARIEVVMKSVAVPEAAPSTA